MKAELWDIEKLRIWEKNPRSINEDDFDRLIKQIQKLGQYKPLIITPEGVVLGGNMRLRALREIGEKQVWVSIVEPKSEAEMVEFALSDNDKAGYNNEDELAELVNHYKDDIDLNDYHIDIGESISLQGLLDKYSPTEDDTSLDELNEKQKVKCPECGHEFEVSES